MGLSEKRFRMLAENARDVIYHMTLPEGRYEYISPAAREVFGLDPEAFYAHPLLIREILHPDWRDVFNSAWERLLEGLVPPIYEYVIIHPTRGMRWLHQRNAVVRDADGKPIAIEGVVTDMTDRKRLEEMERDLKRKAEAALNENEEKYRLIFEKVPVGISQFDAEGALLECNERFADMMGASREQLIGLNALVYTRNDHVRAAIQGALDGKTGVYEGRYTSATGGKTIWGRANFVPIFLKDRKEVGCIGVVEDISDRVKAYFALQESEEKYRGLVERIPDMILLTDLEGRPYYVSPSVTPILGYTPREVIGRLPADFLSPANAAKINGMLSMIRDGMDTEGAEMAISRKDGRVASTEWNGIPVRLDGDIVGFQLICRDHTDRREAEEEIRKSRERLRNLSSHLQTSREQERKRIAREIHDALGQTLTAIKLDIAWLKKQLPKSKKDLIDKTEALIGLVDATIMTVKRLCSELRPGLLDDLGLFPAMEWLANDFQKRTGIRMQVAEPNREITMNDDLATSIFRIFQEALTNIARHSHATAVRVSLTQRPKLIELEISDNGIGITREQISHRGSFGLMGMAERAHALGGGFRISGVAGEGTTITVRIPSSPVTD